MITMILLVTFLSIVANSVGMISGFGIGTIMTPLLVLFMPFYQAIVLVAIIHWFHDIWKLVFFHKKIDWELFLYFGLPSIFASMLGALLVTPAQSDILSALLGLFLIGTVTMIFCIPNFELANNWINGLIGGSITGFFAGIFGIRGAIRSVFLVGMNVYKDTVIGTTGIISLCLDSARLLVYYLRGLHLETDLYWGLLAFVPASFIGSYIGQHLLGKISQGYFRLLVSIFLIIVGIKLLVTPWLKPDILQWLQQLFV